MLTSTQLTLCVSFIVGFVVYGVICGDVTSNAWRGDPNLVQPSSGLPANTKSTTPWPALGQRRTTPANSRVTSQSPKKWIQQNNIWIRNEQGAAGGGIQNSVGQTNVNNNSQKPGGNLGGQNRNQPGIAGPGTSSNLPAVSTTQKPGILSSTKPSLTVIQPNVSPTKKPDSLNGNNQQGIISGAKHTTTMRPNLPGRSGSYAGVAAGSSFNQPSLKPAITQRPSLPGKPGSFEGVVAGTTSPASSKPSSPAPPKASQGGNNLNTLSTGPEGLGGNQNIDEKAVDTSDITDDELREFSEMLIRKDSNNAMKHVTLNLQGMTTSRSSNDEAPQPLLSVNSAAFQIPSIEKLILLHNNYILEAAENEVYTAQERIEENNLLDIVLATPAMQYARSFLIQKGKIGRDPREFKDLLRLIWFNMYSRGKGRIGSSGFEHVFLAEIKNNQVSGLHNWIYFNEEEAKKRANYLGYLRKIDLGNDKGAIVKYHFRFNNIDKPVGSMFIGTSPELEMAVYSTCFVLRPDRPCPLKMGGNRFVVRTYTYRYRGKNMIGSAFPEI